MKKLLLPSLLILALGLLAVNAQNITRSVQLSQDGSGPIGFDTNNNVYFPNHENTNSQATPTLTQCGTSPTITGTDTAGTVAAGSAAGTCTINYRSTFVNSPSCLVSPAFATMMGVIATSGGMTAVFGTQTGMIFNYLCKGIRG